MLEVGPLRFARLRFYLRLIAVFCLVTSAVARAAGTTAPTGYVDSAQNASNGSKTVPQNGNLFVGGWASATQSGATISRVQVTIDGTVVGNASLGSGNVGWALTYNIGNLAPGNHQAGAIATDSNGSTTLLPWSSPTAG